MKNLFYLAVLGLIALSACGKRPEKTILNLQQSLTYERTAAARYTACAEQARGEGLVPVARLFDALARSERVHAERFEELLDELNIEIQDVKPDIKLGTTLENLSSALKEETRDVNSWYLSCKKDAYAEKQFEAAENFIWSLNAEKQHQMYLSSCLKLLQKNPEEIKKLPSGYLICPICGLVADSSYLKSICSSCTTPKDIFLQQ